MSYLLLSQKYEATLTILFFFFSLPFFTNSLNLESVLLTKPNENQQITKKLNILASLVHNYHIKKGKYPQDLTQLLINDSFSLNYAFTFCLADSCQSSLKSPLLSKGAFWISGELLKKDDKQRAVCYINDSFASYTLLPDGTFKSLR